MIKKEKKIVYNYETKIIKITEDDFYNGKEKPQVQDISENPKENKIYTSIVNDFCKHGIINKSDLSNKNIKKLVDELCFKINNFDLSIHSMDIRKLDESITECKFNILKVKLNNAEEKIKKLEKNSKN